MAKKLLSPELSVVLRDIDNTREAINEKYALNGFPDQIPAPLLSGDMAEAVRAIQTVNELPELDGRIELSVDYKRVTLPGGYYKEGIDAKIKDYVVGYVWNRQGLEAKRQHVNIGDDFTIPDFLNGETHIPQVPNEEFLGWSSSWVAVEPHYLPGMVVSNFEFERNLNTQEYIAYLYAVWRRIYNFTLTYSANGGVGAPPQESFGPTSNDKHDFLLNTSIVPAKESFKFIGWGDTPDGTHYITHKVATAENPNPIVYALWEEVPTIVYCLLMNVLDATTNQHIPQQCSIKLREGSKTTGVTAHNFTTNNDGTCQTEEVSFEKTFKAEVSATGFITDFFDIQFTSDEIATLQAERNFPLSPILQNDELFRTSVTWNYEQNSLTLPKDIDSHICAINNFAGTKENNYTDDYINYLAENKNYTFENGATLSLDVDNTNNDPSNYGKAETITLKGGKNVSFMYYLYDYTGIAGLSSLNQSVRVRYQTSSTNQKTITNRADPQGRKFRRWNVFKYENGVITIIDTYQDEIGGTVDSNIPTPPATQGVIDLRLSSLSITPGTLNPSVFSKDTHVYEFTVPKQINSLNVSTQVIDSRTNVAIGDSGSPVVVRDANGRLKSKFVITVSGDGSANTIGNGVYTIKLLEQLSDNNNLSGLTLNAGTLSPRFSKNTTEYFVEVENNISSIELSYQLEDSTARASCDKGTGAIALVVGTNNINITVTAEDGSVKTYKIIITRKAATVTPGPDTPTNPSMPTQRETATILLPTPQTNFSTILPGSCITSKYGYWELDKAASSKYKKLREAYVRIYNMLLNNGEKINGIYEYSVTQIDGTVKSNIPMFAIVTGTDYISYTPTSNSKRYDMHYEVIADNSKKYLSVYLADLNLSHDDIQYVYDIVMDDCPELMFKFQATYRIVPAYKQMSVVNGSLEPSSSDVPYVFVLATERFFAESTRKTMMQTCVDTLNEINKQIDTTYGIKFKNADFVTNNQLYSSSDMVKIGKVIHDYLEANNIYGRASGHYINQTMYPALSRGKWNPVCASYARAFQYCCWRWGIISCYVSGICDTDGNGIPEDTSGHAWSIVSYQNKPIGDIASKGALWQEVDCTWDDSGLACDFDYGRTKCVDLEADVAALTSNTTKTTGWNDATTCRWAYFNISTADINANAPNASGTSGGAGCRKRRTSYKYLVSGTNKRYTYSGSTLYGGFESIT